ncbi:hypothetical protein FKR81_28910 [Lentzea tibetensis]|uniref:Pentapeptide repeat-containing protein n=1 Tax=Lentzea tibetensis TaxID=2591470 RepID=A0A563EML5_9PSEU|nr:hypothetical protein [Lentzea tibetensis]TWP48313.1 hypothetical protein FKR81_28910 [Lentzea tibetensis]
MRFGDGSSFERAEFGDHLVFGTVRFEGSVALRDATFGVRATLDILCRDRADFTRASFGPLVEIQFVGPKLHLQGVDFSEGGSVRVLGAAVNLSEAKFDAPFLVTSRHPDLTGFTEATSEPRVLSLDEANVGNLVLEQVDLSRCEFGRAHNLDELRIGRSDQFLLPPRKRRRVLYEEYRWETRGTTDIDQKRRDARQIERIYRSLRKGFEDRKNAPGAADFYYGEMEMRRRGTESKAERYLLYWYWLLAGYGLRAWRALTTLAVVFLTATLLFGTVGFASTTTTEYVPTNTSPPTYVPHTVQGPKPGWSEAVYTAAQSSMSLVRPATNLPLTSAGRVTDMVLRIICPLLLALALLAIRARVKR